MTNVFNSLRKYAGNWKLTASRLFTDEEKAAVKSAEVVASQYGSSVCFHLVSGELAYIPLSQNSTLAVGDTVDLSRASLITLSREGDADIQRVEI